MTTDITIGYHLGNAFSLEANEKAESAKDKDRARIVRLLDAHSAGLTCEEIESRLRMKHQTASARLTELKRDGVVIVSGRRRTSTGTQAGVNLLAMKSTPRQAELFEKRSA